MQNSIKIFLDEVVTIAYNSLRIETKGRFEMGSEVLAQRLRALREEKGISIRQLAATLEMSHVAISYYENQKRVPDLLVAKKFADYFNTSCDYLIGLTDERYRKD